MAMVSVSRHVARAFVNAKALVAAGLPSATFRALSYEGAGWQSGGGGRGRGGGGAPWSRHGGGGDLGMMGGSDRPPRRVIERRPGDWDCAECGNHVFGSRSECPRCHNPKPYVEGEVAGTGGMYGRGAAYRGGGGMQREPSSNRTMCT
eukprot:g6054.t1